MDLIYSALLLHEAKQNIDEGNISKVLQAAGLTPDAARIKGLLAALEGVDIEEAISKASMPVATAPVEASAEKKEEKHEEDDAKKAEQAVEGLAGLFG